MSEAGPSKPRLRANKACENCRLRKTRCSGVTPCEPCKNAGLEGQCFVREKARPNRPTPAILARARVEPSSPPQASYLLHGGESSSLRILGQLPSAPLSLPRQNPLLFLRDFVQQWGTENGINAELLLFHDSPRLSMLATPRLPPYTMRCDFEDNLMDACLSEDFPYLKCLDETRLRNLYSRYRTLPETLTEDQNALIYASLCLARYNQLRREGALGNKSPSASLREDLTYYRMAWEALRTWETATVTGMWALSCLALFVLSNGSPGEYGDITALWARYIEQLGLHERDIAQVYHERDLSETLLASYCYGETLRAIMMDLTPAIPFARVDLDLDRIPNGISHSMARASNHAVRYLCDYANHETDLTADSYIAASEEEWSSDMAFLRAQRMRGMDRIKQGWAEMRLHWLRILLYIPRVSSTQSQSGPALMILARSLVNIINIHSEAAQVGKLDPSWPQLIRVMTCGQLLVLCCARGELHTLEATAMFNRLIALLRAHKDYWPAVQDAITGFSHAAQRFDVVVPGFQLKSRDHSPSEQGGSFDGTDWSATAIGADMDASVDLPEQGTLW